jgi:hypothetical protein
VYAKNIDKTGITASDFTIMIENVHDKDSEEDIKEYLKGIIGSRADLWGFKPNTVHNSSISKKF